MESVLVVGAPCRRLWHSETIRLPEAVMQDGISAVVPVYNSEECLPALVERLHRVLSEATTEFEIILVNDGSGDRSWSVVEQLAAQWPRVTGVDLLRNYGQHNALLAGVRQARFSLIVTLDDDL